MSRPVIRLPGTQCVHFMRGRCFYQEHLNPGYDATYRCRVLARLMEDYDGFLARCEALNLSQRQASSLWDRRLAHLETQETCCQAGPQGATNVFHGCEHLCEDVCLLCMPECLGQCSNYSLQRL